MSPLQRLLQTKFRSQDSPNISDDDDDDDDNDNNNNNNNNNNKKDEHVHVMTAYRGVAVYLLSF